MQEALFGVEKASTGKKPLDRPRIGAYRLRTILSQFKSFPVVLIMNRAVVHVCQARTCRARGSDATLIEIEELASQLTKLEAEDANDQTQRVRCDVKKTGCLGYCSRGPAVAVVSKKGDRKEGRETNVHTAVNSIEKSAAVVEAATRRALPRPLQSNLPDKAKMELTKIRAAENRRHLTDTYQWNKALQSCIETAIGMMMRDDTIDSRGEELLDLKKEMKIIMANAGYSHRSVDCLIKSELNRGEPFFLESSISSAPEGYVQWDLENVEAVTPHSAVFMFRSNDRKRGTPHPRGSGTLPKPNTWHVTMLGCIGEDYTSTGAGGEREGPLPWIERDYTPISSALDWERGQCAILIKVYGDGKLTPWLDKVSRPYGSGREASNIGMPNAKVWLSKPVPTLFMPAFVSASEETSEQVPPASVLLLLAGTGIVALPQILAHRDPIRQLGISTPRRKQLRCPIDLIHSCREDDVLMLPEIRDYCIEGGQSKSSPKMPFKGLRSYTLLLSGANTSTGAFRNDIGHGGDGATTAKETLKDVSNATILEATKIDEHTIAQALARIARSNGNSMNTIRIVVSGPGSYNAAVRSILVDCCRVESSRITILSA